MKTYLLLGLFALAFALSGCATLVKGTTQSVSLTTPPADGAMCELKNSEGTWYLMSPGSVEVHKTKNDLDVTCRKVGYQDSHIIVPAKFNGVTAGNILVGGVIGIGIDAASGANYGYDASVAVPLTPLPSETMPELVPPTEGESDDPTT